LFRGIVKVNVGRWGIFGDYEVEIFDNACLFATLCKARNMLQHVFRFPIEFIERRNKGLALSSTIRGA
jgi:hypothetical protein